MSLNVKGLNSPFKRSALLKEATKLKRDILFIQETYLKSTQGILPQLHGFSNTFFASASVKKEESALGD